MAVSDKIKALLKLKNKEISQIAEYLGISKQAFSNKLYRDSFSSTDLIKIANFLNCDLAFVIDNAQKIILDLNDIENKD